MTPEMLDLSGIHPAVGILALAIIAGAVLATLHHAWNLPPITEDQVEAAALALAERDSRRWEQYREFARAAFRAAGFQIAGEQP